jgi:hypothetical protein
MAAAAAADACGGGDGDFNHPLVFSYCSTTVKAIMLPLVLHTAAAAGCMGIIYSM